MRALITGVAGFIGSTLAERLLDSGADVAGIDCFTDYYPRPMKERNVSGPLSRRGFRFVESRIQDADLSALLADRTHVFHLAAQAIVRASYHDPVGTFSTNLMGTVHVLEACRGVPALRAVVIVTSDKCYEESNKGKPHGEYDPLGGYDPYAASKACAEIATAAYRRSFLSQEETGVAVATARAGNVIGGGDWAADRLVSDLIRAYSAGQRARLRSPHATRPWQHVLDPLSGYLLLAERLHANGRRYAEAWNFGPAAKGSATVETVAGRVAQLVLGSRQQLEVIVIRQKPLFDLCLLVFRQIAEQVSNH